MGRLGAKGCTFKFIEGTFKVIRRAFLLMKGKRIESNVYELQVDSSSLGHKLDDGVVFKPKLITNIEFDHIIEHGISYTFENENGDASSYDELVLETINEVIDVRYKRLHQSVELHLEQGMAWNKGYSNKATRKKESKWCIKRAARLSKKLARLSTFKGSKQNASELATHSSTKVASSSSCALNSQCSGLAYLEH